MFRAELSVRLTRVLTDVGLPDEQASRAALAAGFSRANPSVHLTRGLTALGLPRQVTRMVTALGLPIPLDSPFEPGMPAPPLQPAVFRL